LKFPKLNTQAYTIAGKAIGFALEQPLHVVVLAYSASGILKQLQYNNVKRLFKYATYPQYQFGYKNIRERLQKVYHADRTIHIIKLPADESGDPDWQFMENYIKALPYSDKI
jgi:hypothetical protein